MHALLKKHHRHNCDNTTGIKVNDDGNGVTGYDDDGNGRQRRRQQHSQLRGGGRLRGGGGANTCDATTSWPERRGGVKDGCVRRMLNKR